MASKASKSAKQKGGKPPSRISFAAMPGSASPPPGIAPLMVKLPTMRVEDFTTQAGRWLAPGEAVTVHGLRLPGGMIYVGASLPSLNKYDVEPALIDPNLRVKDPGVGRFVVPPGRRNDPDYQHFTPIERWNYLKWLSTGRKDTSPDPHSVYLFLYGLERRIIAPYVPGHVVSQRAEPRMNADERQALRNELKRLSDCYGHPTFQQYVIDLLIQIDLSAIIAEPEVLESAVAEAIGNLPRVAKTIHPILALVLAYKAAHKKPLTAEWAWTWFRQDPESTFQAPARHQSKEVRRLFDLRFIEATAGQSLLLQLTKSAITASYTPISPGAPQSVSLLASADRKSLAWVREVNREPLQMIREIAYGCMDALDAYSRRAIRSPQSRDTLSAVALLPDPLFAEHPAGVRFRKWLDAKVQSASGSVALLPVADLIAEWQETKSPTSLTKTETITLLMAANRLGFSIEPDPICGGAALAVGKEGDAVAAIARSADRKPIPAVFAAIDTLLYVVDLPLLVRAARASGITDLPTLQQLSASLPHAGDPTRIAARLAWLAAHPRESARLPKPKENLLSLLAPEDQAAIADVLAAVATHSGAVSPAAVTELIRLFALLGLPDSELYSRLHATASTGSVRRTTASESLPTVRKGKTHSDDTIPPSATAHTTPKAKTRTSVVAIDHDLVQKKEAESAQIGSFLADIFTEEAPTIVAPPPVALPAPGSLDARHAAFLRALLAQGSWSKSEVAALARAENLLPNAAIEAINEAAFERFDEPILDGDDPIYVSIDLAHQILE